MSPPPDLDTLSSAELKALVLALLARVSDLERTVIAQRDEIGRLKGLPGRPTIKPSGMENATEPKPVAVKGKRRRGGCVFRCKPAGDSDPFQPVIPTEASH